MRNIGAVALLCLCAGCGLVNLGAEDAGSERISRDAGLLDAGSEGAGGDAGNLDSGTDSGIDAGPTDAGGDAGSTDSGIDAGPTDAGGDAGSPDSELDASIDAGLPDAATFIDAGRPDASTPDAGGADAGTVPDAGSCTTGVPGPPTNVIATAGNAEAAVMWDPPACQGGGAITGYTVVASPGNARITTTGTSASTVSGLTNGTSYTFTVSATNVAGTGTASLPSNAVTPSAQGCTPGAVEENAPLCMASPTCGPGNGQCTDAMQSCESGSWVVSQAEIGPTSEICNNLDDDCDGYTDNGAGLASDTLTVPCNPLCESWNFTYASPARDVDCVQAASPTVMHPASVSSFAQVFTVRQSGALTSVVLDMPDPFPASQSNIDLELASLGGSSPQVVWAVNHVTIPSPDWAWSGSSFTIDFSPQVAVTAGTQYQLSFTFPVIATGFSQATAPASGSTCDGGSLLINGAAIGGVVAYQTFIADETGSRPSQCRANIGQCVSGSMACVAGALDSCLHEIGPSYEVCNNLDDDCDGYTDNSFIPYTARNNTLSMACSPLCSSWNRSYMTAVPDVSFAGASLTSAAYSNVSSFGQSFTPASSGLLESFTFVSPALLSAPSDYSAELTRTFDGALIAAQSVTSPQLTSWTTGSPFVVDFGAAGIPAPITAGTQYVLQIYTSSAASYAPATVATFTPSLQSGGPLYGGGSLYLNGSPMSTKDFSFSTIVLPYSNAAVPDPCTPEVGRCVSGARLCSAGLEGACEGEIGPSAETCNGQDDDCDGYTDNVPGTLASYSLPSCSP
jgi:hypothetical protein